MPRNLTTAALLIGVCCVLSGCLTTEEKTVDLPVDITSQPSGGVVHYRIVSVTESYPVPREGEWIYLGRTPYQGDAKLPKEFMKGKKNRVEFKVTEVDHRAVVVKRPARELDIEVGVKFKADLHPMWMKP